MKKNISLILSILPFYAFCQSLPTYVPSNGLVAFWLFNGNADDLSGNGNHGTVVGATLTTDRYGNPNNAYYFDGNSYITGNDNGFPIGNSPKSTSFWIEPNCADNLNRTAINISSDFVFGINTYANTYFFSTSYYDLAPILISPSKINQMIHVVVTFNQTEYKIYFNRNLVLSTSISSNTFLNGFYFGKPNPSLDCDSYKLVGKLDDIGIWNRVLTDQEILDLYYSGMPCTKPEPVSICPNAATELCPNDSVSIEIISPADSANYTYQWTRNGTNMPGATTRSITVNDAAKYKVFVRSGPGTNCQRVSGLVETTAAIPPAVTASTPNGNTLCPGDSVLMTATGATSGYSYRWKRYGVVIPGATSSTYYATQTGNYRCEIYNTGGCITQSNLISINNGSSCRLLGELDSDVSVYPNPAKDNFTVSLRDLGNENPVSVSFRTLQGQNIETRPVSSKEYLTFTVGKLAPGIYVVSILLDSGDSVERSIVVQ